MDKFTSKNKIFDLVEANYHLLAVIDRFGISLGNKSKSLEQICLEQKIDVDFFLLIVNTFHNDEYFPEAELKSFSTTLIVNYLKKTHQHYLNYVLPKLESLLRQLIESNKTEIHQLDILEQFYHEYKDELLIHIKEEEEIVFPYIESLIENKSSETKYCIHTFEKEHSNVDEKLNDLKGLIIKYIKPVYDANTCIDFLGTLYRFEKDIKNHARIEDVILLPQVLELESHLNG